MMKPDQRLVDAFYEATLFQIDQIKNHGWKKFSANFLREYARAKHAIPFSNSKSPQIMDEVLAQHPHLKDWIKLNRHAKAGTKPRAASVFDDLDGPDDKDQWS